MLIPIKVNNSIRLDNLEIEVLKFKDLNVYDPTWKNPEEAVYYGVQFSYEYTNLKMLETGFFGVVDNIIQNHPLLTGVDEDFAYAECVKP